MNYDCQWEDIPSDITWSQMAGRLKYPGRASTRSRPKKGRIRKWFGRVEGLVGVFRKSYLLTFLEAS